MLCECPIHGQQYGVLVSPDLVDVLRGGHSASGIVRLEYLHEGLQAGLMYLSAAYAATNEVRVCGALPLPAVYPSWVLGLVPACSLCAREKLKRSTLASGESGQFP
jgi:hypothetical protein